MGETAAQRNRRLKQEHAAALRALKIKQRDQKLQIQLAKFQSNQTLKEERWRATDERRDQQIAADNAAQLAPLALDAAEAEGDSSLRQKIVPWALGAVALIGIVIFMRSKKGGSK